MSRSKSVVPTVEPIVVDINGAARMLCTTVWAVRSLLWDGKLPYLKIGRKFVIDVADVRAFVANAKVQS